MPQSKDSWDEISRMRDGFFRAVTRETQSTQWTPNTDVFEEHGSLVIRMELAGASRDSLEIEVADRVLLVRGIRTEADGASGERVFRQVEVEYGTFSRTIALPAWADTARVEAHYRDGFLHLVVPRIPEPARETIRVDVVES